VIALAAAGTYVNLGQMPAAPSSSVIVVGRNPLVDHPAPDFTLESLTGQTVSLADYRGRPLIVNFWASWCGPCQEEFPLFVAARATHAAAGLEILGIVHNDTTTAAQAFADKHGAHWPLLSDPDNTTWAAYKGWELPISYYIDRQGVIRAVSYGPPPSGALDDQLAKIL
jgi:cytochrome c biogenesis protein CcmG, thiol:disulfide interchange protein DsbE